MSVNAILSTGQGHGQVTKGHYIQKSHCGHVIHVVDHRETESHGCSLTLDVELVLVLEIAAFQADFHQSAVAGH